RAKRLCKLLELQEQGQTYVDKLRKILLGQGQSSPDIEVVFVLGRPIQEQADNPERVKNSLAAVSPGSRITHYDTLIHSAERGYAQYLKASKKLDRLEGIVERI
ncbi:MAG: ATP-binding protein, partial [Chloroflexota bacterium]|nr:ATP-binding protein [Chloroflexota bacterium]